MSEKKYFKFIIDGKQIDDEGNCDVNVDFTMDWNEDAIVSLVSDIFEKDEFFRGVMLKAGAMYLAEKYKVKVNDIDPTQN
jgi:hypothetical protein